MRERPVCAVCAAFLITLFLLLTQRPLPYYNDDTLSDRQIYLSGIIMDKEIKNQKVILYLQQIVRSDNTSSQTVKVYSKEMPGAIIYLSTSVEADILLRLPPIGSRVEISGKGKLFELPTNPGQFDMARYYQIRDIDFSVMNGKILKKGQQYSKIKDGLYRVRYCMMKTYDQIFNEKEAGVVKAMVLGDKTGLDRDIKELYQRAGLSHALCISGLHIALIGMTLYRLLKKLFFNFLPAAVIAMPVMVLYGMMTGMGSATKRAVIMFVIAAFGDAIGRAYDLLTAAAISAVISAIANPLLLYDAGFLLSYGAVLGIGLILPCFHILLKNRLSWILKYAGGLLVSLSVSTFTLPISLYFFYQYPTYSLILNFFLIPLMSILLGLSLLAGFTGLFFPKVAFVLSIPCKWVLGLYEKGCSLTDLLPGGILVTGKPSIQKIVIYFLILFLLLWGFKKSKFLFSLFLFLPLILMIHDKYQFEVTMLDVSQGDCFFIRDEQGISMLIDGGSSNQKEIGRYRIQPFLKAKGVGILDYIFISHMDQDHMNGIEELITFMGEGGIQIRNICMTDNSLQSEKGRELKELAEQKGIVVHRFIAGDILKSKKMQVHCIYPDAGELGDTNEKSMALTVTYDSLDLLFLGDLEGIGEEVVTDRITKKMEIVKIAHHGSRGTNGEKLIHKLMPQFALISCGEGNSYGHPHQEVLDRLQRNGSISFISMKTGAVTLLSDGEKTSIKQFKQQKGTMQ